MKKRQHELLPFLAMWADQYKRDHGLNGIHPTHYALMHKYGAPMEMFPIATNISADRERMSLNAAERVRRVK